MIEVAVALSICQRLSDPRPCGHIKTGNKCKQLGAGPLGVDSDIGIRLRGIETRQTLAVIDLKYVVEYSTPRGGRTIRFGAEPRRFIHSFCRICHSRSPESGQSCPAPVIAASDKAKVNASDI